MLVIRYTQELHATRVFAPPEGVFNLISAADRAKAKILTRKKNDFCHGPGFARFDRLGDKNCYKLRRLPGPMTCLHFCPDSVVKTWGPFGAENPLVPEVQSWQLVQTSVARDNSCRVPRRSGF